MQTIGDAFVDSPVALCAWMSEKFHARSDQKRTTLEFPELLVTDLRDFFRLVS